MRLGILIMGSVLICTKSFASDFADELVNQHLKAKFIRQFYYSPVDWIWKLSIAKQRLQSWYLTKLAMNNSKIFMFITEFVICSSAWPL